jgi:hypothetical protein
LEQKIKLTKVSIKHWVKDSVIPLNITVMEHQRRLEEMQNRIESNVVLPKLLKQEQFAYKNYIKYLKYEESMWILKSRCLWLQIGDKNASFFHKQAKAR